MTTCQDLFTASGLAGVDLQRAVEAAFPDGSCEAVTVSPFSPGPVHETETLTRLTFTPIHVHPDTGAPISMAFADAWSSDLSVFRDEKAADSEIVLAASQMKETGLKKTPPQNRAVVGAMTALTDAVRQHLVHSGGPRAFRVYDTAEQEKPNHASVFLTSAARSTFTDKTARKRLFEIFAPVANYRPGRLSLPPAPQPTT